MEPRRLSGLIALIVVFFGLAVIVYFQFRPRPPAVEAPTAVAIEPAAPAASGTGESVTAAAPPEAPAAAPAGEAPAPAAPAETAVAPAAETPTAPEAPQAAPSATAEATVAAPSTETADAPAATAPVAEAPAAPPPATEAAPDVAATEPPAVTTPAVEAPAVATEAPAPETAPEAAAATLSPEPAAPAEAAPSAEISVAAAEPAESPAATPVPSSEEATAPSAGEPAAEEGVEMAVVTTERPPAGAAPEGAPPVGAVEIVVPTFDVIRIEPTGDTVVAGQAEPGATVELLDGERAVATAEANDRGEWAMSLDRPLTPGAHDLAVRTTSEDRSTVTLSDQRIAVSVPEKAFEEALVVLNTPDSASRILQVPAGPNAAEAAPGGAAPGAPAPVAGEAVAAAGSSAGSGEAVVADAPRPEGGAAGAVGGVSTGEGSPSVAASGAASAGKDVAALAPEPEEAAPRAVQAPAAAATTAAPSEAPVAPVVSEEPKLVPEVAVTAVEADTAGMLYIAGIAKTPETVRVYLDDQVLGEATPSPSGTWLLEVEREMPAGRYAVRADQVDRSGNVVVRAEVPFDREIEVATLRPVVEAGGGGGTAVSGAVPNPQTIIIKRGDNLWRISRAIYGRGVRYSTIYQANRDQIRSARWIYPGQVFVVPSGDTGWQN